MSEPKSCANCKHAYIDDVFYEYQCGLPKRHPDLDSEGDPVENTKCKKWEKEEA